MHKKPVFRLLLTTATRVTAAAGVAAIGVATSGASTASTAALPRLNAPGLHADAVPAAPGAPATATNACGYVASIPADRFKGIPVFNAAQAAQPYIVKFFTTQGVITVRMRTTKGPWTTFSFRFLGSKG